MSFTPIERFPHRWIGVVHCTTHFYYSKVDSTDVNYISSLNINDDNQEWINCRNTLTIDPKRVLRDSYSHRSIPVTGILLIIGIFLITDIG